MRSGGELRWAIRWLHPQLVSDENKELLQFGNDCNFIRQVKLALTFPL
jgi:hypothetical protein